MASGIQWRGAYQGGNTQPVCLRLCALPIRSACIYPCYGMAEATVQIWEDPPGDQCPKHEGKQVVSCGSALPGVEIAVVDPNPPPPCDRRSRGDMGAGPKYIGRLLGRPSGNERAFNIRITDEDGGWLTTGT